MDYFALFNIPKKFKIDKKLLSKNFYKLQMQFHPDLFINYSESKKRIILEKSIQINKGYKTLKKFLSRAIYLLNLNGLKIKEDTLLLKNHDFLIKYFSLYEQLDDLKKNNFDEVQFNNFFQKIDNKIEKYKNKIELNFKEEKYKKVIKTISKLLFFKKIKTNLKKEQNIYSRKTN